MATDEEDRCPICLGPWDNVACAVPCLHRFCFICLQQWTALTAACPLCRSTVTAIRHSLQGDQFQEVLPSGPEPGAEPREESPLDESLEWWGGFSSSEWAELFWRHPHLSLRLRPWLRQELLHHFQEDPLQALMVEQMVLCTLPVVGLNEERLAEELQDHLQSYTGAFVLDLIEYAVEWCQGEAHLYFEFGSREQDTLDGFQESWDLWSESSRSWVSIPDALQISPGASRSGASLPHARELSPVPSTGWASPLDAQELSPGASRSWASPPDTRELSPVPSTSRAPTPDTWELSPVSCRSWASTPVSRELSPEGSTSSAASQGRSPVPSPDLSCSGAEDTDQLQSTATAALWGCPGCTPSIPIAIPAEQDQDLELKEAATAAPAPSQGQSCSGQGPRRPLKRKPSSSEDSAPPSKKPPRG